MHICERVGDFDSHLPRRCACKLVDKRKLAADPALREHLNEQLAEWARRKQLAKVATKTTVPFSPSSSRLLVLIRRGEDAHSFKVPRSSPCTE